jgi:hypothetical protein
VSQLLLRTSTHVKTQSPIIVKLKHSSVFDTLVVVFGICNKGTKEESLVVPSEISDSEFHSFILSLSTSCVSSILDTSLESGLLISSVTSLLEVSGDFKEPSSVL